METILLICITLIALSFAASPFLARREEWGEAKVNAKLEKAKNEKDIFYQAIKDVDFEFAEGKLTEKDHDELRSYYKEKAILTLQEIETIEKGDAASPAEAEKDAAKG